MSSPSRPAILKYSTMGLLWRPDVALAHIEEVRRRHPALKPRQFKNRLPKTATEAEKYTADLLYEMCRTAFGETGSRAIPARQQIAVANAKWLEKYIPIGKGASFDDLVRFVHLYTEHLRTDLQTAAA